MSAISTKMLVSVKELVLFLRICGNYCLFGQPILPTPSAVSQQEENISAAALAKEFRISNIPAISTASMMSTILTAFLIISLSSSAVLEGSINAKATHIPIITRVITINSIFSLLSAYSTAGLYLIKT